jgi:hypothetical protein
MCLDGLCHSLQQPQWEVTINDLSIVRKKIGEG